MDVQCSLPAIMELKFEGDGTRSLHSNNHFRIQLPSEFTPAGELHPCTMWND